MFYSLLFIVCHIIMTLKLVDQCLDVLKREDIKQHLKGISQPIMEFILYEINPYIYITVVFLIIIFFMILAILIILLLIIRKNQINLFFK